MREAVWKVKICGITNSEDAEAAVEAGADLLGFVFYPKSPRYVEPETVTAMVAELVAERGPRNMPCLVGVFVNESMSRVREILGWCDLDLAQLHGSESPVEVRSLQPRAYKALRPRRQGEAEAAAARFARAVEMVPGRPAFLIDAYHPEQFGGTGETTDWTEAQQLAQRYPILLAGGLTPNNVADAIRTVQPWGVDVSSGVEARPGKKDHAKLQAFIEAVKT